MTNTELTSRGGRAVESSAVAGFLAGLIGRAIAPGDPDYESARRIWNAMIDKRPGLIVRCGGVSDVARAIRFARDNDLLVAVRGGGHNVGGRALCDGGLVIDLGGMRGVFVDPEARTVRAQGGATLADVDAETHLHGLAVPLGVVSKTGIGGLTLGGGVGWLVRKYGPTVDNVLEFEMVDAEGSVFIVSAERNPDLFWALRGGGGNFGVVTSFLYRAHPVSMVLGGLVVWPRAQAGAVLRRYRDVMAGSPPAELTVYCALMTTPDGAPAIAAVPCWCGDPAEGARVLEPLRSFGAPMMDAVAEMPFPQMQRLLDGAFPDGTRNYWKSAFVSELGDAAIDEIVARSDGMTSPLSSIVVEFYAGPDGRVGTGDGAFAQRRPDYDVGFMAQWTDPAEDAAQKDWARGAVEAMAPYASGGYLLNFLTEEEPGTLRGAFGDNLARLAELKRRFDPGNLFSQGQNITSAAA